MKFFAKYIIFFCLLLTMAHSVSAAILSFAPEQLAMGVGQEFLVEFFLDTENTDSINAMEGTLYYPSEFLELREIRDGNSIINFWIERPAVQGEARHEGRPKAEHTTGQIRFSGITPGGYLGQKGLMFSMVFRAKTIGNGAVEIRDQHVLRNDGQGTEVPVQTNPFRFVISQTNVSLEPVTKQEDRDPPEAFTLEIARDPNFFENKWFVVFATQDKGSGIDYYEIQEQKNNSMQDSSWIRVESPYVLQDQNLTSFMYMRAVDKAGNERVAMLAPRSSPQYARYVLWSILGAVVVVSYFLVRILWRKRRK